MDSNNKHIPKKNLNILNETYMRSRKDINVMWKGLMIFKIEKSVQEHNN